MKTFRFNTNIENTEDLQQVSKIINKDRRIISFKVDMKDTGRVMEVSCNEDISEQEVRNQISEAGYQASIIGTGMSGNSNQL